MIDRRHFLLSAGALALAACTSQVAERPRLDLRFTHLLPITLAVSGLRIESTYVAPMHAPNVDHEFPVPPLQALKNWGHDRLRTIGGSTDRLVMVIDNASAVHDRLRTDRKLTGLFKDEQADRYRVQVAAHLEIQGPDGRRRAVASATASRSITTPEGATLNQREQIWYDTTAALMTDFDDEMERQIRRYMAAWIR